jgi:hypothetical protein
MFVITQYLYNTCLLSRVHMFIYRYIWFLSADSVEALDADKLIQVSTKGTIIFLAITLIV